MPWFVSECHASDYCALVIISAIIVITILSAEKIVMKNIWLSWMWQSDSCSCSVVFSQPMTIVQTGVTKPINT